MQAHAICSGFVDEKADWISMHENAVIFSLLKFLFPSSAETRRIWLQIFSLLIKQLREFLYKNTTGSHTPCSLASVNITDCRNLFQGSLILDRHI